MAQSPHLQTCAPDKRLPLKYLDRRLPRYTSYPTAVQFRPDVGAATYASWLEALPPEIPVSLYLHVPFCAELCRYCGCNTTVVRRYAPIEAYVELIEREIVEVGALTGRRAATSLHFGGGTPTMLSLPHFAEVMATITRHFAIEADAETAVEIDPRTLSRGYALGLVQNGIRRASLGVQDFDPRVQETVGRLQSFAQTARVVDWLRDAGIEGINLDLMYGLPYQTEASIAATIAEALRLEPDRIALFGYAHVPWMKRHQKLIPEDALPDTVERFAQSTIAADILTGAGYVPIGLDHFAKPDDPMARRQKAGKLRRNFQGYTTDDAAALLGFGTSAIGALPQGYVQNAATTADYRDAIAAGRLASVRGRALSDEDRLRRDIIVRLMCDLEVDLGAIAAQWSVSLDHFAAELAALETYADEGLVERDDDRIRVPERARPYVRLICAVFDQYLAGDEARYSRAS